MRINILIFGKLKININKYSAADYVICWRLTLTLAVVGSNFCESRANIWKSAEPFFTQFYRKCDWSWSCGVQLTQLNSALFAAHSSTMRASAEVAENGCAIATAMRWRWLNCSFYFIFSVVIHSFRMRNLFISSKCISLFPIFCSVFFENIVSIEWKWDFFFSSLGICWNMHDPVVIRNWNVGHVESDVLLMMEPEPVSSEQRETNQSGSSG